MGTANTLTLKVSVIFPLQKQKWVGDDATDSIGHLLESYEMFVSCR